MKETNVAKMNTYLTILSTVYMVFSDFTNTVNVLYILT